MEHLEQLASPNLESDSQESVFDRVETLYNTVVSVRWDNVIMLSGPQRVTRRFFLPCIAFIKIIKIVIKWFRGQDCRFANGKES